MGKNAGITYQMDLLIKNGTVITSGRTVKSDVFVTGGKISGTGKNYKISSQTKVIDAKGMYVIPGAIDPHVHMCLPTPAGPSCDDFYTGSRAAISGGTTTILDFVTPHKGQSLTEALEKRKKEASKSLIDFSFHVSPVEWRKTTEQEIKDCIKKGVTSFKVYLAYKKTVGLDENDFIKVLKTVGRLGGVVTVHCEDGDEVDARRDDLFAKGFTGPEYHAKSRPAGLEARAVKRAIELAGDAGCPLYIVHVSASESLKFIAEARKKGLKVFAETCPQYLLLNESLCKESFEQTVKYVISPPLRTKKDNEKLWKAIANGIIDTIGTDHCPFDLNQKSAGRNDFRKIPNGAGGVEHRLALLYTYGVKTGIISLNRWVDIISTQQAKIFGLYPAKGEIAAGSDADIVIWNPKTEKTISSKNHFQNCELEIFEGVRTSGAAEYVISHGDIVFEKGICTEAKNRGRFLKRKPER